MNATFYFLLLIAGSFIATLSVTVSDKNETQDILRRFSTKLLLTFDPPIEFSDDDSGNRPDATASQWDWLHRLEIEEIYDQQKGLAKVIIVNIAKAERAELFYRAEDDLYLETVYDLRQQNTTSTREGLQVKRCTATIGYSGEESKSNKVIPKYYFRLLKKLTQGFAGTKWPGSVLIGPSVFLHSAQAELLARYRERSAEMFERNSESESLSDKMKRIDFAASTTAEMRHRFFVEDDVAIVRESSNGTQVTVVEFSQANYILIDRSPLLTQLAAVVSYSFSDSNLNRDGSARPRESICTNYTIDYLDIDNLTISHLDETNRDLFKQSQLRACFKDELPAERFGFDSTWSRFFQLRSTRFSTNLYADNIDPRGVHVAVDMERHLMRFDIEGQSNNVIDLQHEFIYHMPNEPFATNSMLDLEFDQANSINGTKSKDTNKVRNRYCTIISTESFPGMKMIMSKNTEMALLPDSANRWAYLIGKPISIIYLGVDSSFGQKAHEFEFSYKDQDSLSPLLALLIDPQVWSEFVPNTGSNVIIGKLWIRADCSQAINSHRPLGCVNPTPIKLKIDLLQLPGDGVREREILFASKQVYFTDFEWELFDEDDVGMLDKVYETFDRRLCPIEKLELQMEVEWKEEIQEENFKPNEEFCQHRGQLDDLVFGQLTRYLQDYATFDVELMDLKLRQSLPGTMVAQYSIILSELPDMANSFQRDLSEETALINLKKELLATSDQTKTLFECLSWASQFANSTAVSYSTRLGCTIYGANNSSPLRRQFDHNESVLVYKRDLRSSRESIRNSVSGLKLFKTEHIDAINHEIVHSNRDDNGFEACVSRPIGQSLVRDIKFGKLRLLPPFTNQQQQQQQIPVKLGFKFVELLDDDESLKQKTNDSGQILIKTRQHFEVISFSDCMRRCNELVECTSFSFCKNIESEHQFCQLSDIQLSLKITRPSSASSPEMMMKDNDRAIRRQSGCQLHSKDYLMYFEEARNAAELAGGSTVKLIEWTQLINGDASRLECARLCHQKGLECMRFIHCGSNICYGHLAGSSNSSLRIYQPNECTLYKKKSLELYQRLLSTDHGPFNWELSERKRANGESLRIEEIPGLVSEERCAQLCTENIECQSFDSCSSPIYTSTIINKVEQQTHTSPKLQPHDLTAISLKRNMPHFTCTLLSRSLSSGLIFDQATANNKTTSGSNDDANNSNNNLSNGIELPSRHCSHFERQGLKQASDFIIELLSSEETNSKHRIGPSADSKAASLFSAAVLGLLLGIASNMLVSFVLMSSKKQPLRQTDAATTSAAR